MKMTKYTHSCVRFEQGGNVLVLDPGTFSEVDEALDGAHAILVTHEHADHLDRTRVFAQMQQQPGLELFAPQSLADLLRADAPDLAARIHEVQPNTAFTIAGFGIQTFGGQHALIHPLIPMVANIGYLVEGRVYHPGDSLVVPNGLRPRTVLVPVHAPWSKLGEVLDFVIATGAERAYPIHDALLNETGLGMVEGHVTRFGKTYGTEYRHLSAGESVEL
ncbi:MULTISPECIES: MBL fold metallo-hydrolase [unclassified Arthrobacter]|uniref:MBL fold metallo-hydrolase n=1 Tax=unclassified Arthrobacter TaxID=235627 RepID=UPI001D1475D9|nr:MULTISPECIES: MBL fold metallo-hydrolase [unclassified Arthrobacter]MCC3276902.1 MBL fold metallo-hydrolase [Arthrobacter sp. zg-Y20]MCC3277665.1 MBL fold metallo-hydrolase [Arthrobacter sp. zg-Y40]MCC9176070.1 MBL fold metallo-hydrolase [Arthrobacter sp. zg-Y750]MDK1317063.1 MBL fold metallo-hydrolase [Arthrobacter sp. zg.Y20]MDK1327239.1 MBL fold metallo-hydrolase [Arthrobacter sp. zg-Y1143]